MDKVMPLYVDGKTVVPDSEPADITNPATEETAGKAARATEAEAQAALQAAERAFKTWSAMPLAERSAWMEKLAAAIEARRDEVLDTLISETGKPIDGAVYDYEMLVTCLRWFPVEAERLGDESIPDPNGKFRHAIIRQPLGVVAGFLAWNFPLLNLGYKLGPALASGCTVVIKPSRLTPLATLLIGVIAADIGFPAGVINILAGPSSELGPVLSGSTIPSMLTMIGSSAGGRAVIAQSATSIKRFSLELGGNAPVIVYPDADVEQAAEKTTSLKFVNTGQVCVSPNRVFVHESVVEGFVEKAKEVAGSVFLGAGRETEGREPAMGPMLTPQARERVQGLVKDAVKEGAEVVCGGKIPADKAKGYYFEPTVLSGVLPAMRVAKEEIFGPVMPVIAFSDTDDVVKLANDTEAGLASYVFTGDMSLARETAERLDFGTVCVNEPVYEVYLPHGGIKESGVGKDCSRYSLEEYYYLKRISTMSPE